MCSESHINSNVIVPLDPRTREIEKSYRPADSEATRIENHLPRMILMLKKFIILHTVSSFIYFWVAGHFVINILPIERWACHAHNDKHWILISIFLNLSVCTKQSTYTCLHTSTPNQTSRQPYCNKAIIHTKLEKHLVNVTYIRQVSMNLLQRLRVLL